MNHDVLVIESDSECQKILLNAGLLGLTKPILPDNTSISIVRFRKLRKTWFGLAFHFAHHPLPQDNGFHIVAVEEPLTAEKRELLLLAIPPETTLHDIPFPDLAQG